MMIVHLCQTPPNMSSIGALCDRLGKTFLTFLLGNLGATGGLRVNSSPAYNLSFVLADGSAILPMIAKEACGIYLDICSVHNMASEYIRIFVRVYFMIFAHHCTTCRLNIYDNPP